MTDALFQRFSELIYAESGIHLPAGKKTMLTGRLSKRLRALGLPSFEAYFAHVSTQAGRAREIARLIDAVTTNKTEFFRERWHFDYLQQVGLSELCLLPEVRRRRRIRVWSAGCSSGEEPYTLAMVLADCLDGLDGFRYEVLATDISEEILSAARRAVYREPVVAPIPPEMKRRYLMRGKGAREGFFRIVPELRSRIAFRLLNLQDPDWGHAQPLHIVFCRNVMIYFDKETQEQLYRRFCECLVPGGYLCIGHSEKLFGVEEKVERVAPTLYRKKNPSEAERPC